MTRKLKITIVAHGLKAGGGISVGKNIISSLTRKMSNAEFQIIAPKDLGYEDAITETSLGELILFEQKYGLFGRWLYDEFTLSKKIENYSPAIILCLGNIGVKTRIAPQILLLQDSHYFYPERHYATETLKTRWIYRYKRHRLVSDLKHIILLLCQTKTAIERVRSHYDFNGDIALLPNAVSIDSLAGNIAPTENLIKKKTGEINIFYLSRYYPHKNIEIFLDLFSKYASELSKVTAYITIEEHQHPGAKRFLGEVKRRGLTEKIINIGPIRQQDIASYFHSMDALVMPSTLESFSGTYLEAMAFDCPILTSDLDFAHEVCGDAALYFDPWSVESLYSVLLKLISNPQLAFSLVSNGHTILSQKHPSWEQNSDFLISKITRTLE